MGLGDFGDTNTYAERILFFFFSLALPVIMLNLLIAMMGDIYDQVQERQQIEDEREKLLWIDEFAKFYKFNRPPSKL